MIRRILPILFALAAAAHAGLVYDALCDGCLYAQGGLEHGTGRDPFICCAVYLAPEWGRYVTVEFDLAPAFSDFTGVVDPPPPRSAEFWDFFHLHPEEYSDFNAEWSPPERLDSADPPADAEIRGAPEDGPPATLILAPNVWDEEARFTCPRCGTPRLRFTESGLWD